MELFQDFILSQWLILLAFGVVFIVLSRQALKDRRQTKGYALGVMIGFFFIIVRLSVAETNPAPLQAEEDIPLYLNEFQVFVSTLFGLAAGSLVLLGIRYGMNSPRAVGIQIAIYTAMIIILGFMVVISNPVVQKMIGIFGLAIGMASLFALVLMPDDDDPKKEENPLNIYGSGTTGTGQVPDPGSGGGYKTGKTGTLNRIREQQKQRGRFNNRD